MVSYFVLLWKIGYCTTSEIIVNELLKLCYSHRKKRMKQLQKKIKSGTLDIKKDDPFELFIAATNIRYCYYNETHKILGNTYGMLVLQVKFCFMFTVLSARVALGFSYRGADSSNERATIQFSGYYKC